MLFRAHLLTGIPSGRLAVTELQEEIRELCRSRDAVILAHYYVDGAVQEVADYVGDSFYLAKVAKSDSHRTIVFCGVTFMGESACILNPDKTVLMPAPDAVCPMALMVSAEDIAAMRAKYDDLAVVCYINSMADIKALSDICVTSSNALKVVRSLPQKNIFFIPDGNLGRYVAAQVPEKNIILNKGFCHVHASISARNLEAALREHPGAEIIAHPECNEEVCSLAEFLGSTKELIEHVSAAPAQEFIVCTEQGVLHEMRKAAPGKQFYFVGARQICPNMKRITLENVRRCLAEREPCVTVEDALRQKAAIPLERMLAAARS